jgi:hypothetical protein
MKRTIRKLLILMIIGAAGAAVFRSRRRSHAAPAAPSTEWPPFEARTGAAHNGSADADSGAAKTGAIGAMAAEAEETHVGHAAGDQSGEQASDDSREWVVAVDGACPTGYPIKVNPASGIFHVPGGRSYERTVPQRCYASAEAAERDGYRQAKA